MTLSNVLQLPVPALQQTWDGIQKVVAEEEEDTETEELLHTIFSSLLPEIATPEPSIVRSSIPIWRSSTHAYDRMPIPVRVYDSDGEDDDFVVTEFIKAPSRPQITRHGLLASGLSTFQTVEQSIPHVH